MTTPAPSAAPTGRRARNKADKSARILAAASARFTEQGYEATTMAQVARDAGVAIGTVFAYAASKPELLMMVTAQTWAARLPEPTALGAAEEPATRIVALLAPLLDIAQREPENSAAIARELLFGAAGPHRDAVVALVAGLERAVEGELTAAGATPEAAATAARLVISGGLLEINRTRWGLAEPDSAVTRVRDLVALAARGALG